MSGWFQLDNGVAERAHDVGLTALGVYVVLARHADSQRQCWPSVGRACRMLGIHKSTALRALSALEAAGWIVVERTQGGANKYTLPPLGTGSTSGTGSVDGTGSTSDTTPVAPVEPGGSTSGTLRKTKEGRPKKKTKGAPAFTLEQLIEKWNDIDDIPALMGVAGCRDATKKRKQAFRVRCQDAKWVAAIPEALEKVAQSRFLQGENERDWKADIDFLLKPDSVTKILEGKYDNRNGNGHTKKPLVYRA